MTIRIVLADDQTLLRSTFRLLLDAVPDMEVVGEAATGKAAVAQMLLEAIRTVNAGESLLSPVATTALIQRFLAQPEPERRDPAPELVSLTPREREITTLVGQGLSNDAIAEQLFISTATAKTHLNRAMTKTGARDRAQLVIFAYENGLVAPGDTATSQDAAG